MGPERSGASDRTVVRWLRIALVFCGIAWVVSAYGIFAPWPKVAAALQGLGASEMRFDPMLDYWLRMTSGAFSLLGVLFFVLAWNPVRHAAVIPWFGGLMIAEGIILGVHGLRLNLSPLPFMADSAACLAGGAAIVWLSRLCAKVNR